MAGGIEKVQGSTVAVRSEESNRKTDPKVEQAPVGGDSYVPKFKPTDGIIKVDKSEDFMAKGRKMFTDDGYMMLRPGNLNVLRLQFALRLEGLDIGKHGPGGWGGDSKLGKDTRAAVRVVMKREGLDYNQAVALLMDRAKNKLGLGNGTPYFNPKTFAYDAFKPVWVQKTNHVNTPAQYATIDEYENQRKYGAKLDKIEKFWADQLEPILVKNGHSSDSIKKAKQELFRVAAPFIRTGSAKHAEVVVAYVQKVQQREERIAWVKAQCDEMSSHLKRAGVSKTVIAAIRRDFFGDMGGGDVISASDPKKEAEAKDVFKVRKQEILRRWPLQEKASAA